MNIVFWNCQGLRPKRKELQNYLPENQIDILALNETFLKPKFKFHRPGVADDHMGSDHFPIQISLDKPLKRNTPLTEPRYRFDKTNDDLLHNTLKDSLSNTDTNVTTQDELEELAVTLCDKLMKAVYTSTPKVYSHNDPKSLISQAILDLIKEKRRLWQLYNNTQDPNIKSTINRLQKEIRTKINKNRLLAGKNSSTPLV